MHLQNERTSLQMHLMLQHSMEGWALYWLNRAERWTTGLLPRVEKRPSSTPEKARRGGKGLITPSSTAAPIRSTRRSRAKSRNRYNNRYRETPQKGTRRKGNTRNLRRIEQKQYPDKSQHLNKLFEIAGASRTPKNPQLNALLEIAGGRPSRQTDQGSTQSPSKKEFKYVYII